MIECDDFRCSVGNEIGVLIVRFKVPQKTSQLIRLSFAQLYRKFFGPLGQKLNGLRNLGVQKSSLWRFSFANKFVTQIIEPKIQKLPSGCANEYFCVDNCCKLLSSSNF